MSTEETESETTVRIRELNVDNPEEVALVAERMKLTLMEVLGEARGSAMYTSEWLIARVLWHLDPSVCVGAVFVAENVDHGIVGHTIVRKVDDGGDLHGLYATTYVTPETRNEGVAGLLLNRGEAWMRSLSLPTAMTATSTTNAPLIALFEGHGFAVHDHHGEMLRLKKPLT